MPKTITYVKKATTASPSPRRTLVFCTSYCASPIRWNQRYRRWLEAIRASTLIFDQVLIIDDASNVLPDWADMQIIEENGDLTPTQPAALFHFKEHLGRHSGLDFPGWYRSFSFAAVFAERNGFEKVVHIESDAFLISPRIINYINSIDDGWVALWSDAYKIPETAIQVIAGESMALFRATVSRPYSDFVGKMPETEFPFTHVERTFTGDRYGEYTDRVPRFADFAAQTPENAPAEYLWWLTTNAPAGMLRTFYYVLHFAQKPLRFAQKPLPEKWAAAKATFGATAAWIFSRERATPCHQAPNSIRIHHRKIRQNDKSDNINVNGCGLPSAKRESLDRRLQPNSKPQRDLRRT